MSCTIEHVRTTDQLEALKDDWDRLLAESDGTIFQTFEWAATWWEFNNVGRDLWCFVVRESGSIIGIAPFYVVKIRMPLLRELRHLKFLGAPLAEYQHPIIKKGCEETVLETLAEYLSVHDAEWDVLDIESVNEQSAVLRLLGSSLQKRNLGVHLYQGSVSAHVSLPASFEEFVGARSKRWRHEFQRRWKGLTRSYDVKIEHCLEPGPALSSAMDSLFEIHDARWKSLGYPTEFDDPLVRQFFLRLTERCAQRGWLQLSLLSVDRTRVAVNLAFPYRQTVYVIHSHAAGPDEIMKYSPGFLIKMKAIEQAIQEKRTRYDLLRGEFAYKYRDFGATPSPNWMIRSASGSHGLKLRFRIFLTLELASKIRLRVQREYIESRRYRISHGNHPFLLIGYAGTRISTLLRTGLAHLRRYAHSEDMTAQGPLTPVSRPAGDTEPAGRRPSLQDFAVGCNVRVKSEAEILGTLDSRQLAQGLPFMPEMVPYCGRSFCVSGWAHKTCVEGYGLRELERTVFLEDLRCDGSGHDGCRRACLLFWKIDWLVIDQSPTSNVAIPTNGAVRGTRTLYTTRREDRYVCQSTELANATRPLPWWNMMQYVNDIRAGQISLSDFGTGLLALFRKKLQVALARESVAGLRGAQGSTPREAIGLLPGECVKAKSRKAIAATLDRAGKNRGLEFAPEMSPLCGRPMRVQERVPKIILEQTGEMRELNDTVLLEGAYCDGHERRWCPRKNYFLWREIWLERDDTDSAPR